MRLGIALIAAALFASTTHFAQPSLKRGAAAVAPALLQRLERGMTQGQVEEVLNAKAYHQFSALISNSTVRCVSYYQDGEFKKHYLILTNNHLSAVSEPPPFEMRRIRHKDSWLNERVLENPEARISKVLAATNMPGPMLVGALKPETPAKRSSSDLGLAAAFLLSQRSADKAEQAQREKDYLILLDRFDPTKIELGSTLTKVESRVGNPQIVEALEGGDEKRYYGSVEFGLLANRELMWLALVYRNGKVIRVFSGDFIDWNKIKAIEKRTK